MRNRSALSAGTTATTTTTKTTTDRRQSHNRRPPPTSTTSCLLMSSGEFIVHCLQRFGPIVRRAPPACHCQVSVLLLLFGRRVKVDSVPVVVAWISDNIGVGRRPDCKTRRKVEHSHKQRERGELRINHKHPVRVTSLLLLLLSLGRKSDGYDKLEFPVQKAASGLSPAVCEAKPAEPRRKQD